MGCLAPKQQPFMTFTFAVRTFGHLCLTVLSQPSFDNNCLCVLMACILIMSLVIVFLTFRKQAVTLAKPVAFMVSFCLVNARGCFSNESL